MMGRKKTPQPKLFYEKISSDKRIRKDHILRNIDQMINFDFIYTEVEHLYGTNGNVSVPPPVILKMMLLLILYNVRSERELMDTIPERLDWLWFLGYDLMERSFARSYRYGFKRTRWRRLWRVKIQELLTSTIQNILTYTRNVKDHRKVASAACHHAAAQKHYWSRIKQIAINAGRGLYMHCHYEPV